MQKTTILLLIFIVCLIPLIPNKTSAAVNKLAFSTKSVAVLHKQSKQLKYTFKYTKKKPIIKWKSSNKNIVTVNSKGKITGKNRGKCVVTMTANNKSTSVTVYVKHNPNINAQDIPVLTFHRIVSDKDKKNLYPNNKWCASVSDFEKQIKFIHNNGYKTISIDQFYNWYKGKISLPENAVLLTDDDGFYEMYHLAYPIIKKYKMNFTNFIVGAWTGSKTNYYTNSNNNYRIGMDIINKTKKEYPAFDYQDHSYNLHYMSNNIHAVDLKSKEELKKDVTQNNRFGFKYYAYPYGATNNTIKNILKNSRIRMAFGFKNRTYATKKDDLYEINRLKVDGQISYSQFKKLLNRY